MERRLHTWQHAAFYAAYGEDEHPDALGEHGGVVSVQARREKSINVMPRILPPA